jgi:hypothetical protein
MRFAATMTFDFEGDTVEQADARARDLQDKITKAATRLGIGFRKGMMMVQAQPGRPKPDPQACLELDNPETIFDVPS